MDAVEIKWKLYYKLTVLPPTFKSRHFRTFEGKILIERNTFTNNSKKKIKKNHTRYSEELFSAKKKKNMRGKKNVHY